MDSINREQIEHNREDLTGHAAVERIRDMIDDAPNCYFCTATALGPTSATRPMNVRKVDEQGTLWFLSSRDSYKNRELKNDPSVRLYFQGSQHSDYLYLEGRAAILEDREKIRELWQPLIKTWFTEGVEDPRITVIRVTPSHGYYWDTKHGHAVAGVKMLIGAAIGKTLDDSIEGTLDP
jgi:general stress protein 26